MKPYDKYQLKKKLISIGKLSWELLVLFSKIVVLLYIAVSTIIFWGVTVTYLYNETGIDMSESITLMVKISLIALAIVVYDWIFKKFKK